MKKPSKLYSLLRLAPLAASAFLFSCSDKAEEQPMPVATESFESFSLAANSSWYNQDKQGNSSDNDLYSKEVKFNDLSFTTTFKISWNTWNGWAVSNHKQLGDGSYKDFSAAPAVGANNSANYLIAHVGSTPELNQVAFKAANGVLLGKVSIANAHYAYYSMKNGDAFSKKFGGKTGNDPDYFKLTITGIDAQGKEGKKVEHYLADFRFADNSKDYVAKDWTQVDLSSLGRVNAIRFSLESTDMGDWGMNTPSYFALDEVQIMEQ